MAAFEEILEKLKERRFELRWSQSYLASLTETTQSAVSDFERGNTNNPTIRVVERIANALGYELILVPKGEDFKKEIVTPEIVIIEELQSIRKLLEEKL